MKEQRACQNSNYFLIPLVQLDSDLRSALALGACEHNQDQNRSRQHSEYETDLKRWTFLDYTR
jgi:hypothetical protein